MKNPAKKDSKDKKIVLAIQGSFGHVDYATGILDAFRAHNFKANKSGAATLHIHAASGCVEMLTPLALYLAAQDAKESMCDPVLVECYRKLPLLAHISLLPPSVRPDAWSNFLSGWFNSQQRWTEALLKLAAHTSAKQLFKESLEASANAPAAQHGDVSEAQADMTTATEDFIAYLSGLPGTIAFSPFLITAKEADLAKQFSASTGPTIFTNATRADNFDETYLYFGSDPSPAEQQALRGAANRRQLLRLTPEYFFASGARPPYIAPMPVTVDGKVQHWMEGAMRCNPPLAPLIDVGATHIVLLRFFAKEERARTHNSAELNERFLDAMFNIPLQGEIESIKLNNHIAANKQHLPAGATLPEKLRQRRSITILDPADRDNYAYSPAFAKFLRRDLNFMSHYANVTPQLRAQMFEQGFKIGTTLIEQLQQKLENAIPPEYDQCSGYIPD
ncbi:MAG: hypothetical protein P4L91_03550 [Burkholderiaceae bacterium]|nr:hypothetical protein [Burkholderiaceae bacterium]